MKNASRSALPKNIREVILDGFIFDEGSMEHDNKFTGANTVIRTGEWEPNGADFVVPFTARITYGKPRPLIA